MIYRFQYTRGILLEYIMLGKSYCQKIVGLPEIIRMWWLNNGVWNRVELRRKLCNMKGRKKKSLKSNDENFWLESFCFI